MSFGMYRFEDGEMVLIEPYRTRLREARAAATNGWIDGLVEYLVEHCPYDTEYLRGAIARKANDEKGRPAMEILEDFIVDAIAGEL